MIKLNYKMGRYVMNEKYRVNSVDFEEYKRKFESKVSDFRQDLFDVFSTEHQYFKIREACSYEQASFKLSLKIIYLIKTFLPFWMMMPF